MDENLNSKHIFVSKSGKNDKKNTKKKDNLGWYAFLFFVFIITYAFFSFVVFK